MVSFINRGPGVYGIELQNISKVCSITVKISTFKKYLPQVLNAPSDEGQDAFKLAPSPWRHCDGVLLLLAR